MISYGVFQGGMQPSYLIYGATWPSVLLGTHVGNELHVALGVYQGTYYVFQDVTYNLTYNTYPITYMATYGITYGVTYYRDTIPHVRAVEWV